MRVTQYFVTESPSLAADRQEVRRNRAIFVCCTVGCTVHEGYISGTNAKLYFCQFRELINLLQ